MVRRKKTYALMLGTALMWQGATAQAQVASTQPDSLKKIRIEEKLGQKIPLNLSFVDQFGKKVQLADYFNRGKPVMLTLAYYSCPMLCTFLLNGITDGIKPMSLLAGKDYEMVTISIDPTEMHELANGKRYHHLKELARKGSDWHFLVGEESQSKALANALGFHYYYDEKIQEYAHPAAAFVLTEDGTISRYHYGIRFKPFDLKLSLLEAAANKIGTTFDHILLYCYRYDPDSQGYVLFARNMMKVGGALTVALLGIFLFVMWRRESRRQYRGPVHSHAT